MSVGPAETVATILVVDDNLQNREVAEGHLVGAGYRVIQAEGGAEALAALTARRPDLVLLDVLMPGMDGYETCRRIRALPEIGGVPVLFLTALGDLETHRAAMESGADDFLTKPLNRTELLIRVRSLLRIKRLSDELHRNYEVIRTQRDALLDAHRQKDELTALIVHDLKNPLSSILSNTQFVLGRGMPPGDMRDSLDDVVRASQSMVRLVMNLLDVSRSEDGALVPHVTEFDVPALLAEVCSEMDRRIQDKEQRLSLTLSPGIGTLRGDRDLVRRTLENLIDNAYKYGPRAATIWLEVAPATMDDGAEPAVDIRVRDEGDGIPDAYRQIVFEKYGRAATGAREGRSSHGLGLVFCRRAVGVHGGAIWIEGEEGRGACFCVRLPVTRLPLSAPEPSPRPRTAERGRAAEVSVRLDDETPGTRRLYAEYRQEIWEHTDRMFLWLLAIQWLAGIATAIWVGPHPGGVRLTVLVWKAFFLGGGIAAFPMVVVLRHPGSALTRQEIAIGQALLTALITHLSGGREGLHALPFVSLAFLAMYRDWTVLLLATLVTITDRVLGCYFWPHSIYGVGQVGHWAWFLDTVFLVIEDLLLMLAIDKSQSDLLSAARKQATIDSSRAALEREVAERQRTERLLSLQYVITRVLAGSTSLAEAAPLILRIMGENQGWQFGELWEVDESRQVLRCVDLWMAEGCERPPLERRRSAVLNRDEGLPGRVWQRHLPLWIADLTDDLLTSSGSFSRDAGLRGGFAIPLRNGPDVIGVMAFYSDEVRQANDDHLSMLSALGGQIGQFMERKRVEQGLRDSEERYRSVIAALDEGIILVDRDGRVIACNASSERILNRKAAEIMAADSARTFGAVVDEDEAPVPPGELPFAVTLHNGDARQNVVLAITRGDGGKVWISMNSQPLVRFGESGPYAAMASFSDITARKAAEGSLRAIMSELEVRVEKRTSQLMEANARLKSEVGERERAQREMREAKDTADTANRAKSAFLANMSHELRTPLNAVIGFSELLEQKIFGTLNDKQRTYVNNVLVSGRHLLQLVNDILDISKVEAGRMDLTYERTPIGSLVDVVRGVIGALAAKRGIDLEVDVPPSLPDVYVDPGRIKQVLYNLISNAIKFTGRGGVVRLAARADARSLVVSVSDTGIGIARADLPRLFREFEQLAQPNGVRPEGTGLGLALTRRLVELHGGRVEVESELGRGSTFSIHLPLRSPDESTGIRTPDLATPTTTG